MSENIQSLPRFRKPPVVETVLGIFFRPLGALTSAEQGVFWDQHFRLKFPKLEERSPLTEMRERFGEERLTPGSPVRWRVMDRPDVPRLWAESNDGQHVIQIQKNAFFSNWLKAADDTTYRPYEERRQEFSQYLGRLEEFLRERSIGEIEPTSWAVTYVNHIDYLGLDYLASEVAKTLTVWTNEFGDDFLRESDSLTLSFAFPMPGNSGRLNVSLSPVVLLKDRKRQVLRLDMTARGQLEKKDVAAALSAIDLGHEWVVRGFASLTRPEMHRVWEREQ
jgi:uncharacterized protein (TIGR04255 family)